jgi:carbon starvation protein
MKSLRPDKVGEVSAIGVCLLLLTVIFGKGIPGSSVAFLFDFDKNTLAVLLALYGFIASVLPVWMLLAPRDYLSSFMKIGVIVLLAAGVLAVHPELHMPATTKFIHGGGPVIPGTVYPFMFITIACGALSGFHSLIASGTTPKMIEKESYARPLGYGAMLIEGFVAVIALIAATVLIPGDYFAINSHLSFAQLADLGFPVSKIAELSALTGVTLEGRPGGAVSLAVGMARLFSSLPFMQHLTAYWYQFALMFEALFILTTIDAGTRVARYVAQELGACLYRPFGDLGSIGANVAASALVVSAWGYFIYTGSISTIWPLLGTANQLLGMLALCIGTTLLIKAGKAKYVWVTLLPMLFMAVTTFTAASMLLKSFFPLAFSADADSLTYKINIAVVVTMLVLAAVIVIDSASKWYQYWQEGKTLNGPAAVAQAFSED